MKRTMQFHAKSAPHQSKVSGCDLTPSTPDDPLGLQSPRDTDTITKLVVHVRDLAGDELAEFQDVPDSKICRDVLRKLMMQVSLPEGTVYNLLSENTVVNHHSPISQYRNCASNVIEFVAVSKQNESYAALAKAREAARRISKRALAEVAAMKCPPRNCEWVCGAVCRVLDEHHSGQWQDISRTFKNSTRFLHDLINFDPGLDTRRILALLSPYVDDDNFRPEIIRFCSLAASELVAWCMEIYLFCTGAENAE